MAKPNAEERRQKKKAAKQKKIVLLLVPVLLIAVGLQLPKLLGGSDDPDGGSTDAAETATEDSSAGAAGDDGETPAPATPAPDSAGPPSASGLLDVTVIVDLTEVPDSDPVSPADEGQLVSFSRFIGDDPFIQLVEVPDVQEGEEQPSEESAGAGGGEETPPASPPVTEIGAVVIQINGELETVVLDGTFPAEDPAFRLVSIGASKIEFGLVEGSFSSGIDTLELELGKSITLISQPDGFRFTIELVAFPAETITE